MTWGAPTAGAEVTAAKVHVIDDDEGMRRSLAVLLRYGGLSVEAYPDAATFLGGLPAPADQRGCVLTDVRMPGLDGLTLLRELRARGAALPVVVMTGHGDVATAVLAMKGGAFDFIEKPFARDAVLGAVRAAMDAGSPPGAGASSHRHLVAGAAARVAALSEREREVLDHLVAGSSNKVIAHDLGLSPRTVEQHRARMMERLGVRSLPEAVRLAVWADLASAE